MAHLRAIWPSWGRMNENHGGSAARGGWSSTGPKKGQFPERMDFGYLFDEYRTNDKVTNRKLSHQIGVYEGIAQSRLMVYCLKKSTRYTPAVRDRKVAQAWDKIVQDIDRADAKYRDYQQQAFVPIPMPEHLRARIPDP